MKVDIEQVDTCVRRLTIEVPADRVDREFNTLYTNLQKRVKLPGFRPGKVPRHILENYYRQSIKEEVLKQLVPDVLSEALTQEGLHSVGQPQIDEIDLDTNQPLRFVATAQIIPDFTLGDYSDWRFERRIPAVEEQHIAQALEGLRERHAVLHTVEGRAVGLGDFAILNYRGTVDGHTRPLGEETNVALEVGAGHFLADIEQALVGMEQGEEKVIAVTLPEDHGDPEVAGKVVQFHVTVSEIKEKVLPDLDDEFARAYAEADSLVALSERLRGQLEEAVRQQADNVLRRDILAKLVVEHPFDVPAVLLHDQMHQMYLRQLRQELGRELREDEMQVDPDSLHQVYGERALEAARGQVILHRIAERVGVTVSAAEVEAEVAFLAARAAQNPETLKQAMERNGSLRGLEASLQEQKVFQTIMGVVHITDTVESVDELAPNG